ncbi:MAG: outer membrane lipoprotein carrier protein LolA [Alphaproteobacteria bacterium]|jgi:outer membrane lipoprotein-sorting protein|nr:outer membrane lipoprotein carrier protein LolA [Alphaproteobacteria bacterium]
MPRQALSRRNLLHGALTLGAVPLVHSLALQSALGAKLTDHGAVISRVEAYLNGLKSLSARFLQVDSAGSVVHGQLYMRRPGRLRFEYDAPSPLLLVADGVWLVLYDRELEQVNRFPLYETPLGVLVDEPVNLRERVEVVEVDESPGVLRLKIVDRELPDEGWMGITFTKPPLLLRQWKIKDAQGGTTALSLTDIRVNQKLDPKLFVFTDPVLFHE